MQRSVLYPLVLLHNPLILGNGFDGSDPPGVTCSFLHFDWYYTPVTVQYPLPCSLFLHLFYSVHLVTGDLLSCCASFPGSFFRCCFSISFW